MCVCARALGPHAVVSRRAPGRRGDVEIANYLLDAAGRGGGRGGSGDARGAKFSASRADKEKFLCLGTPHRGVLCAAHNVSGGGIARPCALLLPTSGRGAIRTSQHVDVATR